MSPFNTVRGAREEPRCERCGLRPRACLCASVTRAVVRTRVVLLTHHTELRKSTNTGRLVALGVEGVELRVRGAIDQPSHWGAAPPKPPAPDSGFGGPRAPLPEGRRLLLFPHADARMLSEEEHAAAPVVLLVPDGTWGQARRVMARDPDARGAEPVTLPGGHPSRYELRRPPREGAVSTLEAVARALGVLEGPIEGAKVERALLDLLDVFVARSHAAAGRTSRGNSTTPE